MTAPTLLLNDGNTIAQIGLGIWPLGDNEVAPVVVAIEAEYRHIDTAAGLNTATSRASTLLRWDTGGRAYG